ncbi:CPBP family intramembrane metalloprotease [Gilvimarinus sp. SDUM040013]|uniref:CPBP family intramembrane glutamic endopeptidase n=1 Tax=Gilvimarinus gilvus TaxID=3058038 RepID=A0ABU4S3M1_9GAMM|nr:CPBP family intramembrane glutamic endopeptidase [Gilvimarinus sp. SDUM040013]MDO3384401.1 CPBP family intramembrane metalloprotease [Gilvimarinus sp. SDUM040013]MDX6851006.1 CPBP family intramembrane glutamic endopeptidase [Gilvimarinus sp. SDUM040013]
MNRKTFWVMALFEGGLGVVALVVLLLLQAPIPLLGNTGVWSLLWGAGAALLTYALLVAALRLWPFFQAKLSAHIWQLRQLFVSLSLIEFAFIATLAGIGEELLFRVLLQSWLDTWLPASFAIIISALIFAAMHWLSVTYLTVTLVMGLVFGVVYHITQSLVLVASWHGIYDFIALVVVSRRPHWLLPTKDQ